MVTHLGLSLPSLSVALVRDANNRSARLPTSCDSCVETISNYPYIAKHSNNGRHRRYHLTCALRIGLVLRILTSETDRTWPEPEV